MELAFDRRLHLEPPAAGGFACARVEGDRSGSALAALPVGAIATDPVETRYGVHIVRLDARAEGALLPFEQSRRIVQGMLERRAWAMGAKALVADLMAEAQVTGVDLPARPS